MKILAGMALVLVGCGGPAFSTEDIFKDDAAQATDSGPEATTGTGGSSAAGRAGNNTGGGSISAAGGHTPGVVSFTGGAGGSSASTGGSKSSGGSASSTGGAADDVDAACTAVVHNDGVGQQWRDCVASGTYDEDQAMSACRAWCAVNGGCACTDVVGSLCGDKSGQVTATHYDVMSWVWEGPNAGNLIRAAFDGVPCTVVNRWN
jgi:hypothetical protein